MLKNSITIGIPDRFEILSFLFSLLVCCFLAQLCLFATLWTIAYQVLLSMRFSRQENWSGLSFPSPRGSSWPGDSTRVSCIPSRFLTIWATSPLKIMDKTNPSCGLGTYWNIHISYSDLHLWGILTSLWPFGCGPSSSPQLLPLMGRHRQRALGGRCR